MRTIAFLAACLLLSGCAAGDAGGPASSDPATSAPPPTVTVETGSIAGVVVDEESLPIAGAQLLLTPGNHEAASDTGGAFTFNDLAPGEYSLVAQRLGFETVGKKLEVRAGEVANATITLRSMVLGEEPYAQTILKVAMFHYGARITNFWLTTVNQSAINQLSCDPCVFVLFPDPGPKAGLTETHWNSPTAVPVWNQDAYIFYRAVWESAAYLVGGDNIISNQFENREQYPWSAEATKAVAASKKALLIVNPSYYGSVEHKVEVYTSFAYHGEFPEDFTALPPA